MSWEIVEADVLDHLRGLPDRSYGALLSDPPYGLKFLGLGWDKVLPPTEVWRECGRVLEPGAPLLVFGGARTFHRLGCSLEDAGLEVVDTLCWLHAQGMPKSRALLKPAWEPIVYARVPGTPQPINIDGSRLEPTVARNRDRAGESSAGMRGLPGTTDFAMRPGPRGGSDKGRWAANVVLDEPAMQAVAAQAGKRRAGGNTVAIRSSEFFGRRAVSQRQTLYDKYGAGLVESFFFCAKDKGEERAHPTQKPLGLCAWLAKILFQPGRRLLVPYSGSGTEVLAGVDVGFEHVLGIENDLKWVRYSRQRIAVKLGLFA